MISGESDSQDARLAALLITYDESLRAETPRPPADLVPFESDSQFAERFHEARECLELLDRVRRFEMQTAVDSTTIPLGPAPSAPSAEQCRPASIGRFQIVRELGRGGLGVVLLAYDPQLRRQVAVKIPRPDAISTDESRRRFVREAESAARLNHRHLVALYEVGQDGSLCYLVSEYCTGPTLAGWLHDRKTAVPFRQAATLIRQLAEAVQHAHSRGVLHRDIKPSNILLEVHNSESNEGGPSSEVSPKLTDFGLAKILECAADETRTGAILGTPAYMAPEQADGCSGELDARTDVYSLGAILYELLAGVPPFRGQSDVDTLRQLVVNEPIAPRRHRTEVPRDLEAICLKCLSRDRVGRYTTAQELADDLERFLAGCPTEARPLSVIGAAWKWARRRPAVAALLALLAVSGVTLFGVVVGYNARLRDEIAHVNDARQDAEQEAEASRRLLYTADVRVAYESLKVNNVVQALEVLDRQVPAVGEEDLREFAWYYLRESCDPAMLNLVGHEGDVFAVAWSPDGSQLASAGKDGTARVWDAATGKPMHVLRGHTAEVVSVAFAPDGGSLATGSEDRTIRFWNPTTGQAGPVLTGHSDHVMASAFSPDGRRFASGGRDASVRIWDPTTGRSLATLEGEMDVIRAIAFSPQGDLLYAVDEAEKIHAWQTIDWRQMPGATRPHEKFFALAASRDGKHVAAAGRRESIGIWHAVEGALSFQRELAGGHTEWIQSLAFSPVDDTLASAGKDGVIRLWRPAESTVHGTLLGHKGRVWSVVWSPDGHRLASGSADGGVMIWLLADGANDDYSPAPKKIVEGQFLPDGSPIAACDDGQVRIWSAETHSLTHAFSSHHDKIRGVSVSADGAWIATQGNATTNIWRRDTLEKLFAIESTSDAKGTLAWNPHTCHLATTIDEKTLVLVDVESRRIERRLVHQSPVRHVAFTPDGRQIVTTSQSLQIWDAMTGAIVYSQPEAHRALAIAPDGAVIAAAAGSNVSLIRMGGDRPLSTLVTAGSDVTCLAIDGNTLAVGLVQPAMVSLWDLRTNQVLLNLNCDALEIRSVAFSPDSRRLVAMGLDAKGQGRIWEWSIKPGFPR